MDPLAFVAALTFKKSRNTLELELRQITEHDYERSHTWAHP